MTLEEFTTVVSENVTLDIYIVEEENGEEYRTNEYYGNTTGLFTNAAFDLTVPVSMIKPGETNEYGVDFPYLMIYFYRRWNFCTPNR